MSSSVWPTSYWHYEVNGPAQGPRLCEIRFGPYYLAESDARYHGYFVRLLRYLRSKGRSLQDAEDLVQEAMLRLHVYHQSNAIEDEEGFLRRAAHNLAIDQYRHDRARSCGVVQLEEVDRLGPLIAPGPTPDVILENRQRLDCFAALLDTVNRRTREIYFAFRSGYTYAEIAADLGVAEITIKRHIARAQAAIEDHESFRGGSVDSQ